MPMLKSPPRTPSDPPFLSTRKQKRQGEKEVKKKIMGEGAGHLPGANHNMKKKATTQVFLIYTRRIPTSSLSL